MTVKTVNPCHAHTMYQFVFMTFLAFSGVCIEVMDISRMAGITTDVLHKYVSCMPIG
jgi:hypothetical protein